MKDIPLPFKLPPPTPAKPARPQRVPADRDSPTPEQHTDLPLSLRGNGGSGRRAGDQAEVARLEQLMEKLDRALSTPSAPSLHDVGHRAVERWAEQAAAGLVSRRAALKLVREVERLLADERRTARQLGHAEERIAQRIAVARERATGTHWKRRDSGRRAQQPTHVEVDPAAWRWGRTAAARQGVGIGELVGRLVISSEVGSFESVDEPGPSTVRLFARLAVPRARWTTFVCNSHDLGLTASRAVGILVERAATTAVADRGSR